MDEKRAADVAWEGVVSKAMINSGLKADDATSLAPALRDAVRAEIRYQTGMAKWDSPSTTPVTE